MNTKSKLAIRTILAILFAISLSVVNIESVGADLPPIKCTLEGLPSIELTNWIPNETVTVTANGEKVGEFTTDGNGFGQFTFGQPGVTYDVSIKNASETNSHSLGSVRCEASSGSLNNIVLTPSSVNLQVGDSLQISAAGFDRSGKSVPITPVWSATGGTITSDGKYTAGSQIGSFTVTASDQGISQSAPVQVLPSKTVPAWIYGIGLAIISLLGYVTWYALKGRFIVAG